MMGCGADLGVRAVAGRVPAADLAARGALRVAGGVHARGREQEAPARGGGRRAARGVRAPAGTCAASSVSLDLMRL